MTRGNGGSNASGEAWAFWACAVVALALHALLLVWPRGLQAGGDMLPHLRLIAETRAAPGLHNVYPPAFHALGALLSPLVGLELFPRLFAFASALGVILAFRVFQRSAGLPGACAALFALSPYPLIASWCLPKIEFAGLALTLLGLAALLGGRYLALGLLLATTFWVHTAAALVFGFAAGVLAVARRDLRALAALAAGSLGALPLAAAHLAASCSLGQSFLFSESGFLAEWQHALVPENWPSILALASPPALAIAAFGARPLYERDRALAALALALVVLYLHDALLAPFGLGTQAGLDRGLSVLAIAVALAGGMALQRASTRGRVIGLATCALWAGLAAGLVVPGYCYKRPVNMAAVDLTRVHRCEFRWRQPRQEGLRRPGVRRAPRALPGRHRGAPQVDPERLVDPPGPCFASAPPSLSRSTPACSSRATGCARAGTWSRTSA